MIWFMGSWNPWNLYQVEWVNCGFPLKDAVQELRTRFAWAVPDT